MKNQAKHSAARFRGFYTALGISLAMIGAACFFAYRQTSSTLEENLNSLTEIAELPTAAVTDQIQAPVIGVKTDVAKETQTVTSAAAQTRRRKPRRSPMPLKHSRRQKRRRIT